MLKTTSPIKILHRLLSKLPSKRLTMMYVSNDVPEKQKQPKQRQTPTAKAKDSKKQEAGRKGAAVRRQKLEALKAELAAAKTLIFTKTIKIMRSIRRPQRFMFFSEPEPGLSLGISLALVAGVVLFAVAKQQPFGKQQPEKRVLRAKPLVPAPEHHLCAEPSRNIFNME